MKKRLLSMVLVLCMVCTLLPTTALAIPTGSVVFNPTTAEGGLDLSTADKDCSNEDEGWDFQYDEDNGHTLTLTDATITGSDNADGDSFGIKVPDNTEIILVGENYVMGGETNEEDEEDSYGVLCWGAITVGGGGSLTATDRKSVV